MLSDAVLSELTRDTPLREHLVALAWPSLTVESKLALIQAIETEPVSPSCPTWLAALAIADEAPIVRFWASRYTSFPRPAPPMKEGVRWPFPAPTDADLELTQRAMRDESPFVRWFASTPQATHTLETPQIHRLLAIRHSSDRRLNDIEKWLARMVNAGVPDQDISRCAREFFGRPDVSAELARTDRQFVDGGDACWSSEGMKAGWDLVKRCGPMLANTLAYALPTGYGMHKMPVRELGALPEEVVRCLIYREHESPEAKALIDDIRSNPANYQKAVVEDLKSYDRFAEPRHRPLRDRDAEARHEAMTKVDETLGEVQQLRRELEDLKDFVRSAVSEAASRKRGIFG